MGKSFKLKRAIRNAAGTEDIKSVKIKDEKDMTAFDFYSMPVSADGTMLVGDTSETIANLFTLTSEQVASLHPKDYFVFMGECGSFLQ